MDRNLQKVYETHHRNKKEGFAIWEKERACIFSSWIGIGKKILDLGCRDGTLTKHYSKGNKVTGVDIDKKMLSICKRRLGIKTLHLNLSKQWPFPAKSFDVVVMGELLEHLYNPQEAVRKAKRVLRTNSILIGTVPNYYHIKRRLLFAFGKPVDVFEDPTHVTVFGLSKLKKLLENEFPKVELIGLGRKSHSLLLRHFANLLAHTFVFKATK